jgi:alpha-amylase
MNSPSVLLLAVHNHQPLGNFRSVFETAFEDCYRPFLREMRKHPAVKFTAHYSGPLLEFMQEKERECWDILKELVARGQVELLGGGFYEPILAVIPEEDRQGQLRMMDRFLEENFQVGTRGVWLTERVWEPFLPKTLARAGIEYTLLDEEHFRYAGIRNIHSYFITEDEGYPLKLFLIDKKLRYLIPFQKLEDVREYMHEIAQKKGMAVLGDDGEKFGLWPGTKKWVYEDGWLTQFLELLEKENIQTWTFGEALDRKPPGGRVYVPPASYEEMMEWVLEPEEAAAFKEIKAKNVPDARRYLRGGFFRDFFLKYPESNHLHKRMISVSREVNQTSSADARQELYRSQGNDPFWHGIFGGIYLPHLRESAYEHLLKAEKMVLPESDWSALDFDQDGSVEILRRGKIFGLVVKPACGGSIIEVDHYPLFRNLTNVLSRRKEAYHGHSAQRTENGKSIHELAKELPAGSQELLRYDRYPRVSCLDRFLLPETTMESFRDSASGECGDFFNQPYAFEILGPVLCLSRQGHILLGGKTISVLLKKSIELNDRDIIVRYKIQNASDEPIHLLFGSEWNFYQTPEELAVEKGRARLSHGRFLFDMAPQTELWHFPIQTLSQSEKGYDIIHQGFCLFPIWRIELSGREEFQVHVQMKEHSGT